jgi:hypothetical protein
VHHDDRLRPLGDRLLDKAFVQVQRVRAAVDEDRDRAAQRVCVRGGAERERRQNDFVSRLQVQQDRRHVEGMRA